VAVETALVSMLLVAILYGVVEVSFLLRDGIVVSSSSRAGARMASSLPRDASFASSAKDQVEDALRGMDMSRVDKVWVFRANPANGLPESGGFASCSTCVRFKGSGAALVADGGAGWAATAQNACSGSQDQLGVYVEYRYPSRLGFLFSNRVLSESTVMRLEPYTGLGACQP
jgi:Flp pilus assembly protein TadG